VVCEIKNDGPSFVGTIEIAGGNLNQGQGRRLTLELPTGTTKRVVIPVFSSTRGFSSWDARLVDERGKLRAEQPDLRPQRQIASQTALLGSLPRSAGGAPQIHRILPQNSELQPTSVRLLPSIFPDNPLVLEGMRLLYLNSEKAVDLGATQVEALVSWLRAGGHLVVGVEQPQDINASPWLKELFPCDLREVRAVERHPELHEWLKNVDWPVAHEGQAATQYSPPGRTRSTPRAGVSPERPFSDLADDFTFETAPLQVAVGRVRDGQVEVAAGETPLIVTAARGRGRITVLLFSPEREPARSWRHLPVLWARLAEVPGAQYVYSDFNQQGGWSSDSIFGAMIDSRQINKLPVGWLLLLLVVYLVVIGPLDHYWLKRIGRPMLTWITFPCYVVVFSLVIYLIGYKLRAGESEWNELHVVDVLPGLGTAELRGRTYASIYSPANQRYTLESRQPYATLRSEFLNAWSGNQTSDRSSILQKGNGFKAEVFVPVWTSQLLVSDWLESAPPPVELTVTNAAGGWLVNVRNNTQRKLSHAHLAISERIIPVADLAPGKSLEFKVLPEQGVAIRDFVMQHGQGFQNAVQSRQHAFGGTETGRIGDLPNSAIAVSFLSQLAQQQGYSAGFIAPPGLDLSKTVAQGPVLLAWDADYAPAAPMRQFNPKRTQKNTFWRVAASAP
ncbi:MAG TPA: hypothetical protein VN673_11665, partial [Clostridia bacterium]|nr:hypothetical protein [Clostridia bacterium]